MHSHFIRCRRNKAKRQKLKQWFPPADSREGFNITATPVSNSSNWDWRMKADTPGPASFLLKTHQLQLCLMVPESTRDSSRRDTLEIQNFI